VATSGRLDWIQALRGIAALLVALTHARYNLYGTKMQQTAEHVLLPAAMGVDLFFLVSGFIMVYTTVRSDGSLLYAADFMVKRFARVWPVYAVIVVIAMIVYAYIGNPATPIGDVARSLVFLPVDPRRPPFFNLPYPVGWTLNFEFYFYVVFAVSLLAGKFRWLAFFGWMAFTLLAIPYFVSGSLSLSPQHDYHIGIPSIDQIVNPIIWDFVAGVGIGLLYLHQPAIRSRALGWSLVVATIGFAIWWGESWRGTFHGMNQWGWPLALMFGTMALAFKDHHPRVWKPLTWLGSISYSFYLVHLLTFTVLTYVFVNTGHEGRTHKIGYFVLIIGCSLVVAEVSRRLLENGLSEIVRLRLLRGIDRIYKHLRPNKAVITEASQPHI
jgi:peptidoglycan/LPS O-acetylase OafA/YrhL